MTSSLSTSTTTTTTTITTTKSATTSSVATAITSATSSTATYAAATTSATAPPSLAPLTTAANPEAVACLRKWMDDFWQVGRNLFLDTKHLHKRTFFPSLPLTRFVNFLSSQVPHTCFMIHICCLPGMTVSWLSAHRLSKHLLIFCIFKFVASLFSILYLSVTHRCMS